MRMRALRGRHRGKLRWIEDLRQIGQLVDDDFRPRRASPRALSALDVEHVDDERHGRRLRLSAGAFAGVARRAGDVVAGARRSGDQPPADRPVAPARKIFTAIPSRRALQPLQRLGDLGLARLRLLALFFFFLDHFLGRARDEIGDCRAWRRRGRYRRRPWPFPWRAARASAARSMTPLSGSAATSPRTTSCTAPCGRCSANDNVGDARQPLDEFRPVLARAERGLRRRAGQHQRQHGRGWNVHLRRAPSGSQ